MSDPSLSPERAMVLEDLSLARAVIDRAAERRTDEAWLKQAWERAETRVLVLSHGEVWVTGDATAPRLVLVPPVDAPGGERYLLGVDSADSADSDRESDSESDRADSESDSEGLACFAVAVDELPPPPDGAAVAGLRELGAALPADETGLLVHAVALEQ